MRITEVITRIMVTPEEKQKIIYPELSYKIIGNSFNVFNELGWGLPEKNYQEAPALELGKSNIEFQREFYIPMQYKSKNIGRYFADFIVENKILLELKVVSKLGYVHAKQVIAYLKCAGLKLGILIYFTKEGIKYRRILNSEA